MSPPAPAPAAQSQGVVTVVVARFDDLLGAGLHQLIEGDTSLEIVAKGVEQSRIPVVLRAHRPDVAILDLAALAKPAEVRELTTAQPQTRLVLLASELTAVESAQLLAFGASACLRRDTQSRDVLSAIHLAARGMQLIPRVAARLAHPPGAGQLLTRREAELLPLLQQAQSNSQIAQTLQIGIETVRTHSRHIYGKLGVSSRSELAALR